MLNLLLASPWSSISETSQVMTINTSLPSGDTGNTRSIHKASDQFGSASCHKVVCLFVYFLVLKHQALTLFCIYIPFLVNGDICCEFQYGYVILVFLFLSLLWIKGAYQRVYLLYYFDLCICLFNLMFTLSSCFLALTHVLFCFLGIVIIFES